MASGDSVCSVARRHGLSPQQSSRSKLTASRSGPVVAPTQR
nr:hypothetical protein [Bradyrhizobium sp. 6(2017)]